MLRPCLLLLGAVSLVSWSAAAQTGEAECSLPGNAVLVPVSLQGVGPYPFVLDAAISNLVVDRDVAAYLKLDLSGGPDATVSTAPLDAAVAGIVLPQDTALVMDLSGLAERFGVRIAGFLPVFLPGKGLTLDLEAGRLTLSDLPEYAGETDAAPPAAVMPTVRGLINGKHLRTFVADTTFAGAVRLPESDLRQLGLLQDDTPRLVTERAPGLSANVTGGAQIRLESLRVGPAQMQSPICVVLAARETPRIGLGFLRHFRVTFASSETDVSVRIECPGALPVRDGPVAGCGMSPVQLRDGYWRVAVARNSPAARAGVASGDQLLEVDGESMEDQPYEAVSDRLAAGEGESVEVTIRHRDREETIGLIAERLL